MRSLKDAVSSLQEKSQVLELATVEARDRIARLQAKVETAAVDPAALDAIEAVLDRAISAINGLAPVPPADPEPPAEPAS